MSISPAGQQALDEPEPDAAITDADDVHRRARWLAWLVVIGAVGIAVGMLHVTGGLDAVPPPTPTLAAGLPTMPAGEEVDVGPATITVNGVVALSDLGEVVGPPAEGNRFIAVSATVAVTDRKTWEDLDNSIRVTGVPGLSDTDSADARLIRSSQRADSLQPGLSVDVGVIFEQVRTSPVPSTVTVTLYCWQRGTDQFGEWWWADEKPCAEVAVEVDDRTAAATATSPTGAPQ